MSCNAPRTLFKIYMHNVTIRILFNDETREIEKAKRLVNSVPTYLRYTRSAVGSNETVLKALGYSRSEQNVQKANRATVQYGTTYI